ncbi:hypothetical protein BXZ70DRAFT_189872 [Cristinia sonorae]|uniref:Transmembrane protein n=1 Tax=Cristinia sonorae TaxID=1940300 RepID=A0A8K0UMM4_9AGAR|nr:hypothetical protein BXZ70DRAFT_189872 [Cristinia sonorae]
MNFTLDDTSPQLVYTPDAWSIQQSFDPKAVNFFQSTYHAAQVDNAHLNMSIVGSAFALYGSKGPGHGNFSVQFDDGIIFLSAYAEETKFQQLLFSHVFEDPEPSTHFVSLTARLSGSGIHGPWLDFDFVTFTNTNTTPPSSSFGATATATGIKIPTAAPPWLTEAEHPSVIATIVVESSTSSPLAQTRPSTVTLVLAALFGGIIGLVLLGLFVYYLLRRTYDSRRAREHSFRYGKSSVTRATPSTMTQSTSNNGSSAGLLSAPVPALAPSSENLSPATGKANNTHALTPPSSPGYGSFASGETMRTMGMDEQAISTLSGSTAALTTSTPMKGQTEVAVAQVPTTSVPFAFLSTTPSVFKIIPRRHKGDADSLMTDFLQV